MLADMSSLLSIPRARPSTASVVTPRKLDCLPLRARYTEPLYYYVLLHHRVPIGVINHRYRIMRPVTFQAIEESWLGLTLTRCTRQRFQVDAT